MNKDINVNKKILKKFLNLLDKGLDMETCLASFPDQRENLKQYAAIIGNFKNLKNIRVDKDFENNSLKDIYLRTRIEHLKNREKISKKDAFLIRLRPAYLKPLVIFLGIFIFMSFSFAGTLYASESSIPGDTLYSLKRTSENIHVAFTPYKYEKGLYLKLLDTRLNEADSILNKTNYIDTANAEKLLSDIDITYRECRERKYLGADQDGHMQIRIRGIEEGFRHRYGSRREALLIVQTRLLKMSRIPKAAQIQPRWVNTRIIQEIATTIKQKITVPQIPASKIKWVNRINMVNDRKSVFLYQNRVPKDLFLFILSHYSLFYLSFNQ